MKEISKEQYSAIASLKKSFKKIRDSGLIVIMVDGTGQIFFREDYENRSDLDCGYVGLFVDDAVVDSIASLKSSDVIH